jgi:hypothetical protein
VLVRVALTILIILVVNSVPGVAQCPDVGPGGDAPLLTGLVLDESGVVALPGVQVIVTWSGGEVEALTGADGRYYACELPADENLVAIARFLGFSSKGAEMRLPAGEVGEHDFSIALSEGPRQITELGRIVGSVLDQETQRPVDAAVVGLVGRAFEAVTDSAGRFDLESVPAGEQELEVRHVAYGIQSSPVGVRAASTVFVEIRVSAQPVELEPIQVTVTGVRDLGLEQQGFYQRREAGEKLGLGRYFTWEDVERRAPRLITQMIADLPGTRLECGRNLRDRTCELGFVGNSGCSRANVYVDGMRVIRAEGRPPVALDEIVLPLEVAGVEVYPSPASVPAEYSGSSGRCGAIIIWTK